VISLVKLKKGNRRENRKKLCRRKKGERKEMCEHEGGDEPILRK